jgi:hypothetical protein
MTREATLFDEANGSPLRGYASEEQEFNVQSRLLNDFLVER